MARRTTASTSMVHDDDIDDLIDIASDASSDRDSDNRDRDSEFGLSMATNTLLVSDEDEDEDADEEDDKLVSLRVRVRVEPQQQQQQQQQQHKDNDMCGAESLLADHSGLLGVPVKVTSSSSSSSFEEEEDKIQAETQPSRILSPSLSSSVAVVSPSSITSSTNPSPSPSLSATTRASVIRNSRQQRQRSSALSLLQKVSSGNGQGNEKAAAVHVVSPVHQQPQPQQHKQPQSQPQSLRSVTPPPLSNKKALSTISGTATDPSRNSSTRSTTSNRHRVPQDVRIVVGPVSQQQAFLHSSHILSYASPVLAAALASTSSPDTAANADHQHQHDHDQRYKFTLALPHKLPHEWKLLQPFLEPHSVIAAHVTAEPLPILLPWFQELQLHVLLTDVDMILKSLVVAWPDCSTAESTDFQDLLLLVQITGRATLPHTWTASMETMDRYLTVRPDLLLLSGSTIHTTSKSKSNRGNKGTSTNTILRLSSSLEVVQELALVLRTSPAAREHLWTSVCMYLPPDLAVYSGIPALTENPLFGYLLREGLEKAVASGGGNSHTNTSFHINGNSSHQPSSPDRSSQSSSSDASIEHKIDQHLKSEHEHEDSWQGDLQRDFDWWWNTWNSQSQSSQNRSNQGRGGSGRNASTSHGSKTNSNTNGSRERPGISQTLSSSSSVSSSFRNNIHKSSSGGGYQDTMDRTAWLEEILRKLKDAAPAIAAAANLTKNSGDVSANATPPTASTAIPQQSQPYYSYPRSHHAASSDDDGAGAGAVRNHYAHVGSNNAEYARYNNNNNNNNSADGSLHYEQPTAYSGTSSAAVVASTSSSMPPRPVRRTFAC